MLRHSILHTYQTFQKIKTIAPLLHQIEVTGACDMVGIDL